MLAHLLHEPDGVHVVPGDEVDGNEGRTVLDHVVEGDHVQVEYHHFPDGVSDEFDDQLEELAVLAERRDHHFGQSLLTVHIRDLRLGHIADVL